MRTLFMLIMALIVNGIPPTDSAFNKVSQNCSAELTVEKNRSFKSADEDGANFKLTLKNTSSSRNSYVIKTSMSSSPCSNKNESARSNKKGSSIKNSNLNISFNSNESRGTGKKQSSNLISIEAGQTKEFTITATAPNGTPYNTWGCIKVEAVSDNCKTTSDEIILSVFVPDPSEN